MERHFYLNDLEFEQKINRCELSPSDFTHEAHLRLAWLNISKYGIEQAQENIKKQILNFVEFVGAQDKYNMTLTIGATKAVYHFMLKSDSDNFKDFISEFPQLKSNFKGLMACHYGIDIYNSDKAKKEFLEPDLVPFD